MPSNYYDIINERLFGGKETRKIKPNVAINSEDEKRMNDRKSNLINNLIPDSIKMINGEKSLERTKPKEELHLKTLQEEQEALEVLLNDEKRKHYDATLAPKPTTPAPLPSNTAPPQIQVEIAGNTKGLKLLPLVDIAQITLNFNEFKTNKTKVDKPSSGRKYQETDFNHREEEGPPPVHIFIFPDKASAQEFIKNLFDKEMAKLPDNTTNMEQVGKLLNQQESAALTPPNSHPVDEASQVNEAPSRSFSP